MISVEDFKQFKRKPLVMITAYDAPFARCAEMAGVDCILVGDSAANAFLGYATTREITMHDMLLFVGAVARGAKNTHIIADMPYGSDATPETALENARQFMRAGAHSVKIEGAKPAIARSLKSAGIPLVGHLGLLPQTAENFRQVGRGEAEGKRLLEEALAMQSEGIFALVLEHIPAALGEEITRSVDIPTVGIGAGPKTDGQVLVLHDVLGFRFTPLPPFAKAFAQLPQVIQKGISDYAEAVRGHAFPVS